MHRRTPHFSLLPRWVREISLVFRSGKQFLGVWPPSLYVVSPAQGVDKRTSYAESGGLTTRYWVKAVVLSCYCCGCCSVDRSWLWIPAGLIDLLHTVRLSDLPSIQCWGRSTESKIALIYALASLNLNNAVFKTRLSINSEATACTSQGLHSNQANRILGVCEYAEWITSSFQEDTTYSSEVWWPSEPYSARSSWLLN